jgi:outer membrane receptor for ferric coprogen and ferric-rhodotorulic acid
MARGFAITNIQIDGASSINSSSVAGSFYSSKSYNLAQFDHIEVLRGASGLFLGSGDPGGAINLSRKRPLDHYQLKFEAAAGSWDNFRTQIDLTGKITDDGAVRGRVVGEYAAQDFFYHGRSQKKPFLYGIVEADVSPRTMLTIGGSYEERRTNGAVSGMPRYTDGRDIGLARSTGWGQPWSYIDSSFKEAFAKIDHEFSDSWKANASYTYLDNRTEALTSFILNPTDPVTLTGTTYGGSFSISDNVQHTVDVNLSGMFWLFGEQHDVVVGADYQNIQSRWRGAWGPSNRGGAVDVFDPESTPWNPYPIDKAIWRDYQPNNQKQYAAYARIGLRLLDPLKINLGGRLTSYSFKQRYIQSGEVLSNIDMKEPTRFVPYGSLTYDVASHWSAYASYAETFTPQQRLLKGPVGSGEVIDPMTGRTWEAGVKGELMHGLLNASAALFHITRNGQGVLDPAYPQSTPLFAGQCCYINQGKVVSKGLDLELTGEIRPGLQLIAGYTFNDTEDRTTRKIFSSITPRHIAKLWAAWQLPGAAARWKIGGGAQYQSTSYTTGTASRYDGDGNVVETNIPFEFTQGAYTVVDAMVEYRINDNLTVTGNIGNLFDKTYYAATGTTSLGNYYGEPRNWRMTLRGKF